MQIREMGNTEARGEIDRIKDCRRGKKKRAGWEENWLYFMS